MKKRVLKKRPLELPIELWEIIDRDVEETLRSSSSKHIEAILSAYYRLNRRVNLGEIPTPAMVAGQIPEAIASAPAASFSPTSAAVEANIRHTEQGESNDRSVPESSDGDGEKRHVHGTG